MPTLEGRLVDFDHLRPLVVRLWTDPAVAPNLKRILRDTLFNGDVMVVNSERWGHEPVLREKGLAVFTSSRVRSVGAAAMDELNRPRWQRRLIKFLAIPARVIPPNTNETSQAALDPRLFRLAPAVFVADRPSTGIHPLLVLMHELAHQRFNRVLSAHLEKLAVKLPVRWLKKDAGGVFNINRNFLDFLSERYALAVEISTLIHTQGRYYDQIDERFGASVKRAKEIHANPTSIARLVLLQYEILDPRVRALRTLGVAQILLGVSLEKTPLAPVPRRRREALKTATSRKAPTCSKSGSTHGR